LLSYFQFYKIVVMLY